VTAFHLPLQYSLQTRLLIAVSMLLAIFLGLTGVVLDRAFRNSVEAGVAEQLQLQIYVLLAAVEQENGDFFFIEDFREPRLSQLNSGLYGFVSTPRDADLLRSPSALEVDFAAFNFWRSQSERGENEFSRERVGDLEYFVASYGVVWENQSDRYTFSIIESTSTYLAEVGKFRTSLWSWLGGVAVLLLFLQLLLMRWGLEPLRRLAGDLKRIESGESEELKHDYPRELQAVTENLNLLIKAERKQQGRYRTTLGDLAHSLKTPLAVIQGAIEALKRERATVLTAGDEEQLKLIGEQIGRMNQIVSYQLQRAVKANESTSLARRVRVSEVINRIRVALDKVYADKKISMNVVADSHLFFLGDERDLMEILGNLLDNAYKYGNREVTVHVAAHPEPVRQLSITVEDDGPGIPEQHREFVLQRGARVDTLARGQGIGLAVVTDIVSSYGGQIAVENNERGGARVQIVFNGFQAGAD
jgi:two-component system, OmpR family, sensor histidine kinase PhoQ